MGSEPNWDDYPNFSREEFVCRCGCGLADMRPGFMRLLQTLRTELNSPIHINSGFRCPEYNSSISSTGTTGPHTTGLAADTGSVAGYNAYKVLQTALKLGFTGIGIKQKGVIAGRFIHLDLLPEGATRPWIWTY